MLTALPGFKIHPRHAAPGKRITADVSGYDAQQYVTDRWGSASGNLLTTLMTDAFGHIGGSLAVPAAAPGTYTIYAIGLGGAPVTRQSSW